MQRAVLEFSPQIVHFSGHGVGEGGLALEDETGQAKLVSAEALAGMFELFADQVECVLLNACYSEVQAKAISRHINYVIGMNRAVGDKAALEFAVGFYDALGAGKSIEFAYKFGCSSIRMAGIAEDLTPVLTRKLEPIVTPPVSASEQTQQAQLLEKDVIETSVVSEPTPISVAPVSLDEPEGQIPLESTFYVERPPIEVRCYETLMKAGALIRIKAPRQMGKSSLMLRILDYATQQGYQAAALNFQRADGEVFASLDQFLQWFCSSITWELGLEERLEDYWKGALGSKNKCTNYFQRYLLSEIKTPFVLCLDEVDQVFQHPAIATDVFGLLRAWHEDAKIKPIWRNLRLVIVHSKEVYIPLNINQSPFNVGLPIELPQLSKAQVSDLVQRHRLNWSEQEVDKLMAMVGGHPYLVRAALYHITRGETTLDQLLRIAPTEEGMYGEHLRRHLLNLEDDAELVAAIKQVIEVNHPVQIETAEAFKLSSMGLVRFQGNDVVPLCNLYRQYFRDRLGVS
jgi:hypothetical protein